MSWHIDLYAILIVVALYQQWAPLIFSVLIVVVHHGVLGLVAPERVFGMPGMSTGQALGQVALHATLAAVEVLGIVAFWAFAEQGERENEALAAEAETARLRTAEAEEASRERAAADLRTRSEESAERARRLAGLDRLAGG
jgi:methyl-accepting chemotaxis protein